MDVQKLKVLIVDDDPRFLEVFKKTLENKSCEVKTASDDLTALNYLINEPYHVVFLDCVLHKMNGMELYSKIKEILGDSVQVVMISGIVSSKSLSSYVDLGVFDFLSKPISESEIDIILRKIKERLLYGKQNNLLIKLFQNNISQVVSLKNLIFLKQASSYEFFLYLSKALSTKDSLKLNLTLNNQKWEIILNNGCVVDCFYKDSLLFSERLLSNGLIQSEEAMVVKNKTEEEGVEYLTSNFILSPDQILSFKYDLCIEILKSIHPGSQIALEFQIIPSKKEAFVVLTQNEYADIVFQCLRQKFNNEVFPLFDKNLMKRKLIVDETKKSAYSQELEPIIQDLKSEVKIKDLYDKHNLDKNTFCFYILYILLKGEVCISDEGELNHNYFYERYKKLEKFLSMADRAQLFRMIGGRDSSESLSNEDKKTIYNNFLKKNHIDRFFAGGLSNNVLKQVNQVVRIFRKVYEEEVNPDLKKNLQNQKKQEELQTAMLMAENKKLMERYLVGKDYKSAVSVLEMVPEETLNQDLEWQLFKVWLYMKTERDRKKEKEMISIMSSIQKNKKELDRNKIYYYIVGLNYALKKEYRKALTSFEVSKKLEYSFKPVYEEIKECSKKTIRAGKKTDSLIKKIFKLNKQSKRTG